MPDEFRFRKGIECGVDLCRVKVVEVLFQHSLCGLVETAFPSVWSCIWIAPATGANEQSFSHTNDNGSFALLDFTLGHNEEIHKEFE